MRYDKKDLPKIVVLFLVLTGLAVYIGSSYSGLSARYKEKERAQHAAHERAEAVAPSGAAGVDPANPAVSPAIAALLAPVTPPDRDPFLPIIAPPRRSGVVPAAAVKKPGQKRSAPLSLPPLLGPDAPGQLSPRDALSVTGIVLGTPSLAVLRRGEDHWIVQQGSELPGRIRVQTITRTSVTLKEGARTVTLRLGS